MSSDNSPTQNRTIIAVAATTVLLLIGTKFALDSYFIDITESTTHEKLASPEQLIKHREAEQKALAANPMPIDQAMADIARRGRDGLSGGGVDLTPKQTDDTGALTGWGKMPRALPVKQPDIVPTPPPATTGAPAAPATNGEAPAPPTTGSAMPSAPATHGTAPHH